MILTLITDYWRDGVCPISHQLKKQLCAEFNKLEYEGITDKVMLAKVLRLVHARPKDQAQSDLFKYICN